MCLRLTVITTIGANSIVCLIDGYYVVRPLNDPRRRLEPSHNACILDKSRI